MCPDFSGNFHNFNCVPNDRADDDYQYIAPNLTLPCDGVVTKWKVGIRGKHNRQVYLQIWQPNGTDYHPGGTIAEVSTNMIVSAGDVIGVFVLKGVRLRVAWASVPDYTILQGMSSDSGSTPVAPFSDTCSTFSSSPLVSIGFSNYVIVLHRSECLISYVGVHC